MKGQAHQVSSHWLLRWIFKAAKTWSLQFDTSEIVIDGNRRLDIENCDHLVGRSFVFISWLTLIGKDTQSNIVSLRGKGFAQFREQLAQFLIKEATEEACEFHARWVSFIEIDRYIARCDLRAWREVTPRPTTNVTNFARSLGLAQKINAEHQRLVISEDDQILQIEGHNKQFVEREMEQQKDFFDRLGLTQAQCRAVVINEDNNLVQAGAGTGKTLTIAARVAYLGHRAICAPHRILVLAFNRKAAGELKDRLAKTELSDIKVATFHSLGLGILRSADDIVGLLPEAEQNKIQHLLHTILEDLLNEDPSFRANFLEFSLYWRFVITPPHVFESLKEYHEHLKSGNLYTITRSYVRSREEVFVANFLTANGIRFDYEKAYEPKKGGRLDFHYKPDFYLSDYDIYLEHFAIDQDGNAPAFMGGPEYVQKMREKKSLHDFHGTRLIESYSWQLHSPEPFEHLTHTLTNAGVALSPLSDDNLLTMLNETKHQSTSNFAQFIAQFVSLQKNAKLTHEEIATRATKHRHSDRCQRFLTLQRRLFDSYADYCCQQNQIDFDDMIFRATDTLSRLGSKTTWEHILVDEFQDSSLGRVALLNSLRRLHPLSRLYCVGDDWQSIYQFAGSDVTSITRFDEHFGTAKDVVLDQTFRFGEHIASTSEKFIKQNPSQSKKRIEPAASAVAEPIEVYYELRDRDGVHHILSELAAKAGGQRPSVFILARYNHLIRKERINDYRKTFGKTLNIEGSTVHRAKGLEADYVIVDKVLRGINGFPNEMEDDPLLELVQGEGDSFPFAEERRLFYVALTRARLKAFIVTQAGEESVFAKELVEIGPPSVVKDGYMPRAEIQCPSCRIGYLVPRTRGANGALFFSCSSYPVCKYAEQPCSQCGEGVMQRMEARVVKCDQCGAQGRICPKCARGLLLKKKNRSNGNEFWACTMWEDEFVNCNYTENAK